MHVAVLEDRLGQHAGAVRKAEHRHELRLHIGGESRERRGGEGERLQPAMGGDADGIALHLDLHAAIAQRGEHRMHVVGAGAHQLDIAPCDRGGAGIAARLDAVGHDGIGSAVQTRLAGDDQAIGADALDLRAHRDEQLAEVDDFRLARGIFHDAGAVRQHGGHQRVFGGADRHDRESEGAAGQAAIGRARLHIARCDLDDCAEGLQRFQMQVDRAVADRAAAGQGDRRFARAGEQRAEHEDGCAHLAHDVIGRDGRGHASGAHRHHPAEILRPRAFDHGRCAELVEQMAEAVHIREARQVAQRQRLIGQQRARQQGQRAVLGAGDGKAAAQTIAAANDDAIHRLAINA